MFVVRVVGSFVLGENVVFESIVVFCGGATVVVVGRSVVIDGSDAVGVDDCGCKYKAVLRESVYVT